MTGVLVFTTEETLRQKQKEGRRDDGRFAYWSFGIYFPTKLIKIEAKKIRLYVATQGKVRGYFKIDVVNPPDLEFYSEDWIEIKNGEKIKPTKIWKYYKSEGEEDV